MGDGGTGIGWYDDGRCVDGVSSNGNGNRRLTMRNLIKRFVLSLCWAYRHSVRSGSTKDFGWMLVKGIRQMSW